MIKRSRQREKIIEILKKHKDHPTAATIYEEFREVDPKVSLGTVYRNLNLLSETGVILRIDDGGSSARFDATTEPHYHHVCRRCGSVSDLDVEVQSDINERIQAMTEHSIEMHQTIFYGTCKKCLG